MNRRLFRPAMLVLAMVAAAGLLAPMTPAPAATLVAHPVVTGLVDPTAFTFGPDGRIWYAERLTGEIRIFDPANSSDVLFRTIPKVVPAGVLGLALHPDYPASPYVYASATRLIMEAKKDQLLRIAASGDVGMGIDILLSQTAGSDHHGGPLAFGPDGKLYLMSGDEGSEAKAQNLASRAGKVHRLNPDGSRPADNPYSNLVFAYGLRNSLGMAFDPVTGFLWENDNGPECNDELNRIVRKGNFGWGPHQTCSTPPAPPINTNQDGPNPILPRYFTGPQTAPTGLAFCQACQLGPGTNGDLFFGEYNTGVIQDVTLNAAHTKVVSQAPVYTHTEGILSVQAAPDGRLYFSDTTGIYRLATT